MLTAVAGVLGAYLLIVAVFFLAQRAMQYPAPREYHPPAAVGMPDMSEVVLTAPDGTLLMVWRLPARPGKPTILYFHGNGDAVWSLGERIALWRAAGWGVAAPSYRGYPGSGGAPSEPALIADAEFVWDWLTGAEGVAPESIVVAGYSMGSGVAVALASRRPAGALMLAAPFTSAEEVAARAYPWLPVRLMMRDRWRSIERIGSVTAPLVVVHGTADRLIPVEMGRTIYAAAHGPKRMVEIPGAVHVLEAGAGWDEARRFVEEAIGGRAEPAALVR